MRILFFLLFCHVLWGQKNWQLASPNDSIRFELSMQNGTPFYSVYFNQQALLKQGQLGMKFKDGDFSSHLRIGKISTRIIDEPYDLVVGKTKTVRQYCRMAVIPLYSTTSQRQVNLIVKVFNDGVAFRYDFPKQKNWSSYELTEELTSFPLSGNPQTYTLLLHNYKTSHEGVYTSTDLQQLPVGQLMDMPTLFKFPNAVFVAISEAALRDYAGMYLQKNAAGVLENRLSPLPGQTEIRVKATLPHRSPWRVMFIGSRVGTILESNILTSLNEPCAIKDVSWIKPGKATWTWWNGDIIKGVNFPVGQNFASHQYYIDWCAANHIEYHSIIEHGNHSWYYANGEGFDPPPPGADVLKPVDSLEIDRLAAYSRAKGVGLRVWVHWKPLSEQLEAAFAQYQKWNIKGLMVDFMDRDDQEMVNWVEKVLKTAAKYQLHVQFHGAYKPTGLQRTYPNEFTKEGVLNLENLKWSKECDPEHTLMIPFTRLIAGATDYHAGGFRSVPRAQFQPKYLEPNVMGTRCHHLALYVVFESYLHLVSDYPQAYDGQVGFEFIKQVPTSWDETKILAADVGNYIATARRKGDDWYIGAMTDWTPRQLQLKLDFLPPGQYEAEIFQDTPDGEQYPNKLTKSTRKVTQADVLEVNMVSGGGQAIHLKRLKN